MGTAGTWVKHWVVIVIRPSPERWVFNRINGVQQDVQKDLSQLIGIGKYKIVGCFKIGLEDDDYSRPADS
jgi:hypothetical protein